MNIFVDDIISKQSSMIVCKFREARVRCSWRFSCVDRGLVHGAHCPWRHGCSLEPVTWMQSELNRMRTKSKLHYKSTPAASCSFCAKWIKNDMHQHVAMFHRAPQGGVPCYVLYGFSMGLLYAITKNLTLL